jgi:hypothetical protein
VPVAAGIAGVFIGNHSGNPDALEGVESLQRCDRRRAIRLFDLLEEL